MWKNEYVNLQSLLTIKEHYPRALWLAAFHWQCLTSGTLQVGRFPWLLTYSVKYWLRRLCFETFASIERDILRLLKWGDRRYFFSLRPFWYIVGRLTSLTFPRLRTTSTFGTKVPTKDRTRLVPVQVLVHQALVQAPVLAQALIHQIRIRSKSKNTSKRRTSMELTK